MIAPLPKLPQKLLRQYASDLRVSISRFGDELLQVPVAIVKIKIVKAAL
ncbi:hypothetical protein HUU05_23580 [candidate division KSB1 bacterium]|nr:hypothetical protein [candidate division KSB1 bacterium]